MVNGLVKKCESLDSQNRQKNLLFFGIPTQKGSFELTEDIEKAVERVIYEGIGIESDVRLDKVHRSGKVVIVSFQSQKDRWLVLRNAKRLGQSEKFSNVFVREDFSETVQEKRRQLGSVQRSMRQRGEFAVLRRDKLMTHDSVFSYDLQTGRVTRTRKHWSQPPVTTRIGRSQFNDQLLDQVAPPIAAGQRVAPLCSAAMQSEPGTSQVHASRSVYDTPHPPHYVVASTTTGANFCGEGSSSGGGGRDKGQGPLSTSDGATSRPCSPVYNLRSRHRDNASGLNQAAQSGVSPTDPRLRGFGRGRGRTPPPQQRTIDSMWRDARSSCPPPARPSRSERERRPTERSESVKDRRGREVDEGETSEDEREYEERVDHDGVEGEGGGEKEDERGGGEKVDERGGSEKENDRGSVKEREKGGGRK